jgi:hypothetical protein
MGIYSLFILSIILPIMGWARGPGISGGGTGVVCRDSQQHILSVKLLDLWEAREVENREIKHSKLPVRAQVTEGIQALKSAYRPLNNNLQVNLEFASSLFFDSPSNVRWLRGKALADTEDSFELVHPDPSTGCKLEPIINYLNNPGKIEVLANADLFEKMDETNQAALILHEAFYYTLRDDQAEKTSIRTRRMIGNLFSIGLGDNISKYIPATDYILCEGRSDTGRFSRVYIYDRTLDSIEKPVKGITFLPEFLGGIPFLEPNGVAINPTVLASDLRRPGARLHGTIYVQSNVDPEWSDEYWFSNDGNGKMSLVVSLLNSAGTPDVPFRNTLSCRYVP